MTCAQRRAGALGATALIAALIVASAASSSLGTTASGGTADVPRVGFRLPRDGTAAGGWIGSRKVGTDVVYRIDPRGDPRARGFGRARWVRVVAGSGPVTVTRWRTRRAAWLLAKYGTYRSAAQSAAVELALDVLLHGGSYGWDGDGTRRRLRQSGAAAAIAPLATYMVDKSAELAGPYRIRVDGTGAVIGDRASVTATVMAQHSGAAIPFLPVTVRFGDRTLSRTTDDSGSITASLSASEPGPQPVTVTVHKLPSDRLLVRRPTRRGPSRVVVAGRKLRETRTLDLAIQARPRVGVSAPAVRAITAPVPGTLHVRDGFGSARSASIALHGPYPTLLSAVCDGDPAPLHIAVTRNGPYDVPDLTVAREGVYRWSVALAADDFNLAAAACGARIVLKTVPLASLAVTQSSAAPGERFAAALGVRHLPEDYTDQASLRLYGPFRSRDAVRCVPERQVRWRVVSLSGPHDSGTTTPVSLARPGVYAWQAVVRPALLSTRELTRCAARGTVVRVGSGN